MDLCDMRFVRPLLEAHGFHFTKARGQNFLTARWVPERIAREAEVDATQGVLEIGPGVGVLTRELAPAAGRVCCVELDRLLIPVLSETLGDLDNVTVIEGDALKLDLRELAEREFPGLTPVVCANLPYNVTSPLLSAIIDAGCFQRVTVMVQREVARRLCAAPGTADYGAFTVYTQYHTEPRLLFDVPPDCFTPRPKVTSSVIALTPRREKQPVKDEALFFKTVKAAFLMRRKTLLNALASFFGDRLSKEALAGIIESCGFAPLVRGETLSIPDFARLSDALGENGLS